MSNIIDKLDMTRIVDDVTRAIWNEAKGLDSNLPDYDTVPSLELLHFKQQLLPIVVKVVNAAAPQMQRVVEAELVDERFTQAVAGLDFSDLEDLPEAGGAE